MDEKYESLGLYIVLTSVLLRYSPAFPRVCKNKNKYNIKQLMYKNIK